MLKFIPITACILAATFTTNAEIISLKTALDTKVVTVKAVGSGQSYDEKALSLEFENKSAKGLVIRIDTATIFRPEDTSYQDIMLAGGDIVSIPANKTKTELLQTYCVKSYARCPKDGLNFRYVQPGSAKLVMLMSFVSKEHIPPSLTQDAVWVISNGNNINTIYDHANEKMVEKLVKFMSDLTGQPMPVVYEEHKKETTPGRVVYTPRALKMYAKFEWKTDNVKTMTLGIYDSTGVMLEPVFENKAIEKGNHRVTVEFESETVPPGSYYIRLMDGNTVFKEQGMKVE